MKHYVKMKGFPQNLSKTTFLIVNITCQGCIRWIRIWNWCEIPDSNLEKLNDCHYSSILSSVWLHASTSQSEKVSTSYVSVRYPSLQQSSGPACPQLSSAYRLHSPILPLIPNNLFFRLLLQTTFFFSLRIADLPTVFSLSLSHPQLSSTSPPTYGLDISTFPQSSFFMAILNF